VIVDKGYQGVYVPNIGHMKIDGRLGRNPLKGALGDALHAVLCGAGHNIRLLLKKLRLLFAQIWQQLIGAFLVKIQPPQAA
jgi:IS5 family transposase